MVEDRLAISSPSAVLRKVREFILSRDSRPSGEGAGDGGEEEEGGGARENSEREFCVDPENVSVRSRLPFCRCIHVH